MTALNVKRKGPQRRARILRNMRERRNSFHAGIIPICRGQGARSRHNSLVRLNIEIDPAAR
jgi:hypothetical protein